MIYLFSRCLQSVSSPAIVSRNLQLASNDMAPPLSDRVLQDTGETLYTQVVGQANALQTEQATVCLLGMVWYFEDADVVL